MRLVVVSHKTCWPSAGSPSGFATDGGFPFQMKAIAELFDETRVVVPVDLHRRPIGEAPLSGNNLSVTPLDVPKGHDLSRKLQLPIWLLRNFPRIWREVRRADAVHTPIPGDIGTIGLLVALILGKPLFIRYCGNWALRRTAAEYFWGWLLERTAGTRTVVLATGGGGDPPSQRNAYMQWIFSTSLSESELRAFGYARTSISPDGPRLIISARQERAKGTGAVIESLPMLEGEFPHISLDVVGDGQALSEFKQLAETSGVEHRVRFHGKLDHSGVMKMLRQADVFCFPTTSSEGFPKAVLEALACGLPVVSTPVSVLGDLIGEGGGVLLDAATAVEVARGIRFCVADTDRYREMSRAALLTASKYSLERWQDTIAAHLTPGWGPLRSVSA